MEYGNLLATVRLESSRQSCAQSETDPVNLPSQECVLILREPFDIPMWRVHMGSTCLGAVTFVIVLFCCEALRYRSKKRGLQLALPWLPLAGLTGLATIIHIPSLIVISLGVTYGIWVYLRTRTQQRLLDS
jgi:hypothetical protein